MVIRYSVLIKLLLDGGLENFRNFFSLNVSPLTQVLLFISTNVKESFQPPF